MSTSKLPNIPSLRKQQLFLEFANLKHAAPPGVYASLASGDPTLWSIVCFVRSGPYASAVLRFQLRFPASYPDLPPQVTFSTDVFHPLIVPLTTYTFSTSASTEDPVSASDEERLPPGGFSLRHGFPHWFGRDKRDGMDSPVSSRAASVNGLGDSSGEKTEVESTTDQNPPTDTPDPSTSQPQPQPQVEGDDVTGTDEQPRQDNTTVPAAFPSSEPRTSVPVSELLDYIRSTFDTEAVLDSLPLKAAGNPGAWHAWNAHRQGGASTAMMKGASKQGSPQTRLPGDWHWDGIWAKRAQDEIEASHSEPVLFGGTARGGTDEMIRFSQLDDATFASIKDMIVPRTEEVHR